MARRRRTWTMRRAAVGLRYLWAFPATAIGLTFAAVFCASGARAEIFDGIVEVGGGGVRRAIEWLPRALRFQAITLGHVVIGLDRETLAACRVHERVHVRQYERWGVFFFPLYFGSSLLALLCGRHPYWYNRFERQAYREETLQRRAKY